MEYSYKANGNIHINENFSGATKKPNKPRANKYQINDGLNLNTGVDNPISKIDDINNNIVGKNLVKQTLDNIEDIEGNKDIADETTLDIIEKKDIINVVVSDIVKDQQIIDEVTTEVINEKKKLEETVKSLEKKKVIAQDILTQLNLVLGKARESYVNKVVSLAVTKSNNKKENMPIVAVVVFTIMVVILLIVFFIYLISRSLN
jgi:hypothetical protein